MTSYVDTILIDCNRKGSEEYKVKSGVDEPAVFTCKQGAGIKLNPGDEVSVHSAYINERGNSDNMEFSGKTQRDAETYELEYTDIVMCRLRDTNKDPDETKMLSRNSIWDGPDMRQERGRYDCMYYQSEGKGVGQSSAFNRKKVFNVVDNEINFTISYYKTMNGEGYLSLPRRFDAPNPTRPRVGAYGYGGTAENNVRSATHGLAVYAGYTATMSGPGYPVYTPAPGVKGTNKLPVETDYWYNLYTAYDGNARIGRAGDWVDDPTTDIGAGDNLHLQTEFLYTNDTLTDATDKRYKNRIIYAPGADFPNTALTTGQNVGPDCYFTGRCRPINTGHKICKDDYRYEAGFTLKDDSAYYNSNRENEMRFSENGQGYKHKQDNARMTIYIQQTTFWDRGSNNSTQSITNKPMTGSETTAAEVETKGSVNNFFWNEETAVAKDVAVNTEWIRYKEIKNVKLDTGYNTPDDVAEQITDQLNKTQVSEPVKAELLPNQDEAQIISVKQKSECYKPFHSANHYTFGENAFVNAEAYDDLTNAIDDQALIDYQTAYHYIGVKRPDLWDAGRATYYDQIMYPGTGNLQGNERAYYKIHASHGINKTTAQSSGARITTTIPWTEENVEKFKVFFDAQANYPELFDYEYNVVNGATTRYSVNDARYLHIDLDFRDGLQLGSDNYDLPTLTSQNQYSAGDRSSYPIFIDYDPTYKDVKYSDGFPVDVMGVYGIFVRVKTGNSYTIGFNAYNHKLGDQLFPNGNSITGTSTIGYDCHFSAYGTKCIMLYTGQLNALYDGKTMLMEKDNNKTETDRRLRNQYQFIRDTYIGANQIEIGVEEKGKFFIHQLHTPEYIGNSFSSGSSPDNPINPDASDQVYRVNKRLSGDNFCPDMVPYRPTISTDTANTNDGKVEISNFNTNLNPYTIYDSMSGIFIEDTGIDQDSWNNSLWGKLGFTWQQFNSGITGSRQTRLNNLINVENIGAITTNADITAGDVPTYPRNAYGGEYYNNSLPSINYPFFESNSTEYGNLVIPSVPAITESQTSVKILADGLPVKMSNPYLLIKSDIVQDTKYYGMGADNSNNYSTGQCLPIVGVVNKENGFGDYYFQADLKMAFTITKPTIISVITTSIHNPDMSLARLEENTAVIYMVKKNNTGNYNIGAELIKKGQLKL